MPQAVFHTAVFPLHHPTQHVRAVLEAAFRQYTAAYTECLHVCSQHVDAERLLSLATYATDARTGVPRANARTLSKRLFSDAYEPNVARVYTANAAPLESHLRQSLREHLAQTLLSYAALHRQWAENHQATGDPRAAPVPGVRVEERGASAADSVQQTAGALTGAEPRSSAEGPTPSGGAATRNEPGYPTRLRRQDLERHRRTTLTALAELADNLEREQVLRADLARTRQPEVVAIPFVGLAPTYGAGIYLNPQTNRFYARLDIVGAKSHLGRPIEAAGMYIDVKTKEVYVSQRVLSSLRGKGGPGGKTGDGRNVNPRQVKSFGASRKSVLCPLEMGRWHEKAQRWSQETSAPVAFLPQRERDPLRPMAATPVSAMFVRRADRTRPGGFRYELHVRFQMPIPQPNASSSTWGEGATPGTEAVSQRPLLAVNRGINHLYAAVVVTPDARRALTTQVSDGAPLLARLRARERVRRGQQQRGSADALDRSARSTPARDRRQQRIGDHECARAANQLALLARRFGAQVVLAEFSNPNVMSARKLPYGLRPLLNFRQREKLANYVDDRLRLVGLPPARAVSAAGISVTSLSVTCPQCGVTQDTRYVAQLEDPRQFVCERCGARQDRDVVAAANIARRFVWMRQRHAELVAGLAVEARTPWMDWATAHPVADLHSPPAYTGGANGSS